MLIVAGPSGANAHDGGTFHPEQPGRIFSVMNGVRDLHLDDAIHYVGAPEADLEALTRVHTTKYLDELESFCSAGRRRHRSRHVRRSGLLRGGSSSCWRRP